MNLEEDFPEGEWDVVFCREIIEHLKNHAVVCKKIIDCLSKSGVLVITAPCDERDGPKSCPQHVRIFGGKELDKLVQSSGGEIIEAFNERRQRVVVARRKS
jgi:2-polyprenyl-3-methyl-5-hydroxy-6-metoxy-1,4-benzoquinol methylase